MQTSLNKLLFIHDTKMPIYKESNN